GCVAAEVTERDPPRPGVGPDRLRMLRWRTEEHGDCEQITSFGAHPVVLGRSCLTPNLPFCARDLGPGFPDRGLCSGHGGRTCAHRPGRCYRLAGVLTPAAPPPAGPAAARAGARPTPPPRAATGPPPPARPGAPPIRTRLTRQRPGDGQELIPRRTGHSGPAGGGRRGVWAFRRRPSAAARRRRSGSILAVSVVPRRRKAAHRCARRAILATAARCRRGRRWPAACRRG